MRRTTSGFYKFLVVFLLLAVVIAIPAGRFMIFATSPHQPGSTETTIIEVRKGQSPTEVSRNLVSAGVVSDGKSFMWLGRLNKDWKRVKAGEYQVSAGMTPLEVFRTLTSGVSIAHPVTVREGENMFEIAQDLEHKNLSQKEHFIRLCRDPSFIQTLGFFHDHTPPTLEGYLYPDTYFFNRTLNDAEMIKQMVRHFMETWGKKEEQRAIELGLSRHQIITLASIIEKETGAPEERPLISSVFHNRLKKKMRLQSDPTTIYGMWERYQGKIHKSDLMEKNLYNTYSIESLPAGPIGNPGKEAIQAALYPAESMFLYFVSHNDGTHEFSKTLEDHNRSVRKFQLDPQARLGKSWRDRLKKASTAR
jgi:UPF0755 protein